MSRKRTGLRNKYRTGGTGTYSAQRKARHADRYGAYKGRTMEKPDVIAGRTLHATQDPTSKDDARRRGVMGIRID